jgi:hypothetical protein
MKTYKASFLMVYSMTLPVSTLYSEEWWMNWKRFRSKLSWHKCIISAVSWKDLRKPRKIAVRMANVPAEIRIDCLPTASLHRYLYAQVLSSMHSEPHQYMNVNGQLHASTPLLPAQLDGTNRRMRK